jgi:hypothetical protein
MFGKYFIPVHGFAGLKFSCFKQKIFNKNYDYATFFVKNFSLKKITRRVNANLAKAHRKFKKTIVWLSGSAWLRLFKSFEATKVFIFSFLSLL